MGNTMAPAIRNPQEAVFKQITMCVIHAAMTHSPIPRVNPFMIFPYLISMSGRIVEGLNVTR
jgi:hypothetical protein